MKLSILIPVYNEEKTIIEVLKQLMCLKFPCKREIIVIDDGSTDGTRKRLKNYESSLFTNKTRTDNIKVIYHKNNRGKGAAIQSGLTLVSGDYILIQDADSEYLPVEIPKLLSPLFNHQYKHSNCSLAIYGSRFKNNKAIIPPFYLFGNKLLTMITNLLYNTELTDMETGYKLLPAKVFKRMNLKSDRFDIEPEITAKLIRNKIKIMEVPISYRGRTHLAGKKLTIADAFEAIKSLVIWRFKSVS